MRISDWSSDVCSSDLLRQRTLAAPAAGPARHVAHDQARGPGLRGLVVQWSAAGIAHVRIGQRADLPRIRRIGADLLVAGHAGVEHHLADPPAGPAHGTSPAPAPVFAPDACGFLPWFP